jgi:hypothetical protein
VDYKRIMCHPEHYAAVFAVGFPDKAGLEHALDKARRLRAVSHHPKTDPSAFTPKDLVDLRVTWNLIEIGLAALDPDWEWD